jgi:hypothetical protein
MHIHTGIFPQWSKNLLGNPGKLPGLRITDCQNTLSSNGSNHRNPTEIQWCNKIALIMTPPRPDDGSWTKRAEQQ